MIVARVNAGMARAKAHGTKTGKAIGRPRVSEATEVAVAPHLQGEPASSQRPRRTG